MSEGKPKINLTNPLVVMILAGTCCLFWGSAFPCIKIGYELFEVEGPFSQILFAGYRFVLAGVLTLLAVSLMEKKFVTIRLSSVPSVFGQGLLQTTIQYLFFYVGLSHTGGAKSAIINGSNALFAIIAAPILIKNEKYTMNKLIGCVLGFGGVIVANLSAGSWDGGFTFTGEGFVLICSAAYGISSVTMKIISRREDTTAITAYQFFFGGGLLILIGLIGGGRITHFTAAGMAMLLYLALLSTIAFSIWALLLKHNPVGKVAIYAFSIPLSGVLLSGIILGEKIFTWNTGVALLLVCLGIAMVNRSKET